MSTVATITPPAELLAFAERQVRNLRERSILERRAVDRHLLVLPVIAQPVDAKFRPISAPFAMVTRDISSSGIGLVYDRKLPNQRLALQLSLGISPVVLGCEIQWCKPAGPFYYLGGRFTSKLETLPQWPQDSSGQKISRADACESEPSTDFAVLRETARNSATKTVSMP